jgi:hypothetical protein
MEVGRLTSIKSRIRDMHVIVQAKSVSLHFAEWGLIAVADISKGFARKKD